MAPVLAETLRPVAGLLIREVIEEIQRSVPAYATVPDGQIRGTLMSAVRIAVEQCFDEIRDPAAAQADWRAVFGHLGRIEFAEGRTLDPLQTAVRIGARVAWRWANLRGQAAGIPPETLCIMAEGMFAWVDELSSAAIKGYQEARARAHVDAADVRDRSRRHLVRTILSGEPVAQEWVRGLAEAAAWPLPEQLVTIAVERRDQRDTLSELTRTPEALVDLEGAPACVLLPDPGEDRRRVFELLGDRRAAVGPAVIPAEASRSLALARRLLGLFQANASFSSRVVWCQDHLATLLLLADPFLTAQLLKHTQSAFIGHTPKQRNRMATTLLAWLQNRGTYHELAARLNVHPQTVRYRIGQLQLLLGDKLTDPDARLTLELALRAHTLFDPQSTDG